MIECPSLMDPWGVAVNPSSNRVYVGRDGTSVSVIDGARNRLLEEVAVGIPPHWLGVNPETGRTYVANAFSNNVSVLYENERLRNTSFDTDEDDDAMPDQWRGRNLQDGDQLDNIGPAYDGRYSFRFSGAAGLDKQLRQALDIGGSAGSSLKLDGFSRAEGATRDGGAYGVEAKVIFADGSSDTLALRFAKSTHDWQREVASFTASKSFIRIIITVRYEKQAGQAWFDALHLQIKR